ncbi:MAG TPA: hypothetical protein VGC30_12465 [Dokdonella sp.]
MIVRSSTATYHAPSFSDHAAPERAEIDDVAVERMGERFAQRTRAQIVGAGIDRRRNRPRGRMSGSRSRRRFRASLCDSTATRAPSRQPAGTDIDVHARERPCVRRRSNPSGAPAEDVAGYCANGGGGYVGVARSPGIAAALPADAAACTVRSGAAQRATSPGSRRPEMLCAYGGAAAARRQ